MVAHPFEEAAITSVRVGNVDSLSAIVDLVLNIRMTERRIKNRREQAFNGLFVRIRKLWAGRNIEDNL